MPSLSFINRSVYIILILSACISQNSIKAQNYAVRSMVYNSLVGAFSGGVGSMLNKQKGQKWYRAFAKGFVVGAGGGMIVFGGKKANYLIAKKQNMGYGWASRAIFSAGNSIVENAAANREFWSVWHYDLSFVRVEFNAKEMTVSPRIMPSMLLSTAFMAANGKLDVKSSLRSGTATFYTKRISYSPNFVASTPSNGFLFVDSLRTGQIFYDTYAHEMIHTFQFAEFSGCNYFFKRRVERWENKYAWFKKIHKYVYGDINYVIMGFNYFFIQKGHKRIDYCRNFLENEAESLSTNRPACPEKQ